MVLRSNPRALAPAVLAGFIITIGVTAAVSSNGIDRVIAIVATIAFAPLLVASVRKLRSRQSW